MSGPDPVRALTRAELAAEAGTSETLIDELVSLGQLRPLADGRFDARDAEILETVRGLEGAGADIDDIRWLIEARNAGLLAIGPMFATPAPRDGPTYRELSVEVDPAGGNRLAAIYAAFGLAEPDPDRPLRRDEASLLRRFVGLWADVDPDGDAAVRTARITGDASRRTMESFLDLWDEVVQPALETQGAPGHRGPMTDPADPSQNPSIVAAQLMRDLVPWLQERQLELTLNGRIINAMETRLVHGGRLPARPEVPTAIAFVDLTDYTSLTVRAGDEKAAETATRLAALADECARAFDGRVIKLLGDGVMLRFDDPTRAVEAICDLLRAMAMAGLPPGHAGIAAGRVVTRDGDVFGRTVNLAARIAAHATGGELLIDDGVAGALGDAARSPDRFTIDPVDAAALKGFDGPIALWRVTYHRVP